MSACAALHHGHLFAAVQLDAPVVAATSDNLARPSFNSDMANEYLDSPATLALKCRAIAALMRSRRHRLVYTGAGISTASGISDYASRAATSVAPHKRMTTASSRNRLDAQPTASHHAISALYEAGLVQHWLQQNHDRLAQKAGYPQAQLNEVHGAWGDSKNRVLMMDEMLRDDLHAWMCRWAARTDCVLALGSSLCGMSADAVCAGAAARGGLVICSLQRTPYDDVAAVRVYALLDDFMRALCAVLGVKPHSRTMEKRGAAWAAEHPKCYFNTPVHEASDDESESESENEKDVENVVAAAAAVAVATK